LKGIEFLGQLGLGNFFLKNAVDESLRIQELKEMDLKLTVISRPPSWALVLLVFALNGCHRNATVVQVGDYSIKAQQIEAMDRVIRVYFPTEQRPLGKEKLIKAFSYAQILKNNGRPVSEEDLIQEEKRIEARNFLPDKLARIKSIFKEDEHGYRETYVLSSFVERELYFGFFLQAPHIQNPSKEPAIAFKLRSELAPKSFAQLAKAQGLALGRFTVSTKDGVLWDRKGSQHPGYPATTSPTPSQPSSEETAKQSSEEGQRWISERIGSTEPGHILPQVIDMGESWVVAKLLGPVRGQKESYSLESVHFPKANFSKWLQIEQAKVKIAGVKN
jgi:hypothetical protein